MGTTEISDFIFVLVLFMGCGAINSWASWQKECWKDFEATQESLVYTYDVIFKGQASNLMT